MAKGIITVIINPETGRKLVDIDAPNRECEKLEAVSNLLLKLLGVEATDRQGEDDPRPKQVETTGSPNKVRN